MPHRLVDDAVGLAALLEAIAAEQCVAIDTEAASFHRYHDRIYLIQLSTTSRTAIVDPLRVGDLSGIGALLADASIEKIFHDGDYDLRLFDKDLGFHARNLFDTRIAAQLLNEPGIGLAALLEKYLQVKPDKRFQRADWSARPLTDPMLAYAAGDTEHLHTIREILRERLVALGRLTWLTEECTRLETIRWSTVPVDPETAFLRLKGAKALPPRALAILRELYNWRETLAAQLDRALFRVLGNEVLFLLAEQPVTDLPALTGVRGMNRDLAERRGEEILAAIARGLALPDDLLPRPPRSQRFVPDPIFEARVESLKRTRNAEALRLDLAPGVLCPNGTLEAIARAAPTSLADLTAIPDLRRWQVEAIGAELLKAE